jgi:hypothetical protein
MQQLKVVLEIPVPFSSTYNLSILLNSGIKTSLKRFLLGDIRYRIDLLGAYLHIVLFIWKLAMPVRYCH